MISVVIRNKNQADALSFLLKNLTERYIDDIDEIIVIDNLSNDESRLIAEKYNVRFEIIEDFSYGRSANLAAQKAIHPIVVIFSAHSYPVSHDFFKLIKEKFRANPNLAGLRCLHNPNDYRNFINDVLAKQDPNKSGLIFSGSAFSKKVWEQYPFNEDMPTFEDKEWTIRVLKAGFDIEFVPSIFAYEIKRTKKQLYNRFKNDVLGNYQLWNHKITVKNIINNLITNSLKLILNFFIEFWYLIKKVIFLINFLFIKHKKFKF